MVKFSIFIKSIALYISDIKIISKVEVLILAK